MGAWAMAAQQALKGAKKIKENKASDEASSPHEGGTVASMKKGGKVKKTGKHMLHKGEQVLKRKTAKKYRRKHGGKE
jgi:hypothetical protein